MTLNIQYLRRKAKLINQQAIKQRYGMKLVMINCLNVDWITHIIVYDYSCCLVYNVDNPCYINPIWIGNNESVIDLRSAVVKWTRYFP